MKERKRRDSAKSHVQGPPKNNVGDQSKTRWSSKKKKNHAERRSSKQRKHKEGIRRARERKGGGGSQADGPEGKKT